MEENGMSGTDIEGEMTTTMGKNKSCKMKSFQGFNQKKRHNQDWHRQKLK